MTYENHTGAPERPPSALHAAGIESRLHSYPGCSGLVIRYFILHDEAPNPYRTAAEALAELRRRQAERRPS